MESRVKITKYERVCMTSLPARLTWQWLLAHLTHQLLFLVLRTAVCVYNMLDARGKACQSVEDLV